ncbi:hypothetical protein WG66_009640 [Moniliophthora roreri]|uniref:Uncharacterized protein n=1 Tax=Moniliophthora roreri TaxID=221103 RepID=A0A0W0G6T2_MONRR|nr:hypothetical protein WG66_009640 [Moniliophthora roreri]
MAPTHSFSPSVWLFQRLKWNMVQARHLGEDSDNGTKPLSTYG